MMRRRILFSAGMAALGAVIGVAGFSRRGNASNLTTEALSGEALASDSETLLVDIRRPEEWVETGVVEGAILVTYESPEAFLKIVAPKLANGQRLALICRSGQRTSRASRQIAGKVDFQIVDIQGGMLRVVGEGYRPVVPTREMGCQIC